MKTLSQRHEGLAYDEWMARILGRDVFRYLPAGRPTDALKSELAQSGFFLHSKIPVANLEAVEWLEELGFRLIDTNVVFERPATPGIESVGRCEVRFANVEDEKGVVGLARRSFVFSRFHLDRRIPRELADRIKAEWVANYWRGGRGEYMVVAVVEGAPAGFLQLLHAKDGTLTIDLVATAPERRRSGVARDMIAFALAEIRPISKVVVGTQLANAPSIRLYEDLGFRLADAKYVFHFHG